MKTLSPKGFQMVLPGCLGLVLLSLSQSSAIELTQNTLEVHADAARSSAAAPHFSPGISEILKMIDAKVDAEVIKAYIKGSLVAYNPTAGEIIALKDRGVPNEVLTVLIQRGGELRGQQPMPSARPPAMTPPYESGTPDDYGSQPGAPYQASYPDYGYSYPSYSYPSYYSYGYGYPWYSSWYWPYFGFYPYYGSYYGHYYGHYGHYGHGNYHDGHSHGIHASGSSHGAGFSGHGQAWAAAGHNNSHSFAGGTRSFTPMGQTGGFRSGSASAAVARSGMSSFHGGGGGGFRGGVAGSGGGGGFRGGGGGGGGFHGGGGGFGGGRGR